DLGFVQELLGHSDPSVTRRVYVEWLKDGFKRSYDAYAGQALRKVVDCGSRGCRFETDWAPLEPERQAPTY
ncbi:MAG: hypothetical protein KDE46_27635, partial [Caldilineaceae bacterium]|nr:hypothetical protein [Caldilineaceae bacterium]